MANHFCFLNGRLQLLNFRIAVAHPIFLKWDFENNHSYMPCDRFKQNLSALYNKQIASLSAVKKCCNFQSFTYTHAVKKRNTQWRQILPQKLYHNASCIFPFLLPRTIISLTEFLSRLDTELLKLDDKGAGFPIALKIRSYLSRK